MTEQINLENVFKVDVEKLALDQRFGSLIFDLASKKLKKAQDWLKEAQDLRYNDLLLDNYINQVNNLKKKLVELLEWLRNFDLAVISTPKQEHDNFNARVDHFYNDVYSQLVIPLLPFLRDERRRENPSQQNLDEEIKKATKIRAEIEKEFKVIQEETEKIRTGAKSVGSAKGERAAAKMSSHFTTEVSKYEKASFRWYVGSIIGYVAVIGTIIWLWNSTVNSVKELAVSTMATTTASISTNISSNLIWPIILAKLVLIAALWYGLSFIIKNYNVNKHLASVNRHRAAVASTLEDFIVVEQQQESPRLNEMLQNATDAMFKHLPVGYVSKTEKDASNPILQVVNDLMGVTKQ